uniref:Uncharacterized protein n=1 Tax=Knipowitschia caucasica TaxID=637954 RepID=A0AAV2KQ90_KNICA
MPLGVWKWVTEMARWLRLNRTNNFCRELLMRYSWRHHGLGVTQNYFGHRRVPLLSAPPLTSLLPRPRLLPSSLLYPSPPSLTSFSWLLTSSPHLPLFNTSPPIFLSSSSSYLFLSLPPLTSSFLLTSTSHLLIHSAPPSLPITSSALSLASFSHILLFCSSPPPRSPSLFPLSLPLSAPSFSTSPHLLLLTSPFLLLLTGVVS